MGISACLTGQRVRHDGGHKQCRYCMDVLSQWFDLRPLCPEAGAGFGTPRPSMRLQQQGDVVRLVTSARSTQEGGAQRDMTAPMEAWIEQQLPALAALRGFILTAKSPSCGLYRLRVYEQAGQGRDGQVLRRDASGLFASALRARYPLLPVEEAARLNDDGLRENFLERVFLYDDWCRFRCQPLTAGGLLAFHTRRKLQLLAHSQQGYRALGRLLANLRGVDIEALADDYIARVMAMMSTPASPGAHVNVMQHLLGYFRDRVSPALRAETQQQIQAYQAGEVPLIVPLTLLRLMQREAPHDYLTHQHYLAPYPDALGLRNRL